MFRLAWWTIVGWWRWRNHILLSLVAMLEPRRVGGDEMHLAYRRGFLGPEKMCPYRNWKLRWEWTNGWILACAVGRGR